MGRRREFEEAEILEKVKEAFWAHGYEGLSYPVLMKETGLHKASLYAAFGDKQNLYIQALRAYNEMEVSGAVQHLSEKNDMNGVERIQSLLTRVIDAVAIDNDRRGCFLCNAAIEQAPLNLATQKIVTAGLERMKLGFLKALNDDPTTKTLSPNTLEPMSSTITSVYFGMRVMAKSGVPISMMKEARNGIIDQIKAMSEKGTA